MRARLAEWARRLPPARVDPGRRGALAVVAVMVVVAVLVGGWVLAARPHSIPVTATTQSSSAGVLAVGGSLASPVNSDSGRAPAGAASTGAAPSGLVVVDVAGKVRHPGVYRLPTGSRVTDAVTAAGGLLPGVDATSVNLAAKLADGQQIVVGAAGPAGGPADPSEGGASGGGASGGGGLLDLNTATAAQLDALPGVGPVLAQRIVDWRTQHGRFDSVEELNSVSGIGDAKFADLKPLVTV